MIIIRHKQFSQIGLLNTNISSGFIRGRHYDMALDRLGRMNTSQRELHRIGDIRKEQRNMRSELNRGFKLKDLKD